MNEINIKELREIILDEIEYKSPSDKLSFVSGFETAIYLFAIWRNGERYFGASDYTTKELSKAIKQIVEED